MSTKERLALGMTVVGAISLVGAIITWVRGDARGALTIAVVAAVFFVAALSIRPRSP